MKKNASFMFYFDSSSEAVLVAVSLSPELKQNSDGVLIINELKQKIPKTNVELSRSKNVLSLKIKSEDVSSLRAACNSYLRWIATAINVKKLV